MRHLLSARPDPPGITWQPVTGRPCPRGAVGVSASAHARGTWRTNPVPCARAGPVRRTGSAARRGQRRGADRFSSVLPPPLVRFAADSGCHVPVVSLSLRVVGAGDTRAYNPCSRARRRPPYHLARGFRPLPGHPVALRACLGGPARYSCCARSVTCWLHLLPAAPGGVASRCWGPVTRGGDLPAEWISAVGGVARHRPGPQGQPAARGRSRHLRLGRVESGTRAGQVRQQHRSRQLAMAAHCGVGPSAAEHRVGSPPPGRVLLAMPSAAASPAR
jgi:hypothetical protein